MQQGLVGDILLRLKHVSALFAAFKELGRLILDVGLLIAHHCDKFGL